jgi:hypothetical protein
MKFTKIVGFGDSWMYGDELLDPELRKTQPAAHSCWSENDHYRNNHCFLGLLGKHYQVPVENFGIPGGSLQSEIWTFLWWLEHESDPSQCLVLAAHTEPDRMSWYNHAHRSYPDDPPWNKFIHSAWTEASDDVVPRDWKELNKRYLTMATGTEQARLNYLQTVLLFDGVAARNNIPMLQFRVSPQRSSIDLDTMIWNDRDLMTDFFRHPENSNGKRGLWCKNGHPNEKGHQLIRDLLIKEIDHATLSK